MARERSPRTYTLRRASSVVFALISVLPLLLFAYTLYALNVLQQTTAQIGLGSALALAMIGFYIYSVMGVALVPIGAYYFFDERLSRIGILGIALIGAGIFALHWRRGAWSEEALLRPGTGWAIATGLCIACYSLVDKVGVSHINPLPYLWAMMLGSCVSLLPAVRARPGSMAREWRENRLAVLLSGVLSPGGYLLVLFAFRLSKAGYVVAGREVSIVISALIGSILLKEGRLPQRLLGAAIVASGVICVALAR